MVQAYAHYANSYVIKPLEYEDFTALMNNLGRYGLGWNYYPWREGEGR